LAEQVAQVETERPLLTSPQRTQSKRETLSAFFKKPSKTLILALLRWADIAAAAAVVVVVVATAEVATGVVVAAVDILVATVHHLAGADGELSAFSLRSEASFLSLRHDTT